MKTEIENRFNGNLERVGHLVEIYETLTTGPGRRPVDTSDILRSAVVFLHAALEDFLRSLLEWKLPSAQASYLKDIPLKWKNLFYSAGHRQKDTYLCQTHQKHRQNLRLRHLRFVKNNFLISIFHNYLWVLLEER